MGGKTGREEGIMYSDSSSLSRASSPVICLRSGEGLERNKARFIQSTAKNIDLIEKKRKKEKNPQKLKV